MNEELKKLWKEWEKLAGNNPSYIKIFTDDSGIVYDKGDVKVFLFDNFADLQEFFENKISEFFENKISEPILDDLSEDVKALIYAVTSDENKLGNLTSSMLRGFYRKYPKFDPTSKS